MRELNIAWRQRQSFAAWNLARRLTGEKVGRENRPLGHVPEMRPDAVVWQTYLEKSGSLGGCSAVSVVNV